MSQYVYESDNDEDTSEEAMTEDWVLAQLRVVSLKHPHQTIWLNIVEKFLRRSCSQPGWSFKWDPAMWHVVEASYFGEDGGARARMLWEAPLLDTLFPNAPPKLVWLGPRYGWEHNLALTFFDPFLPSKWNLCQDLPSALDDIAAYVDRLPPPATPEWTPTPIEMILMDIVELSRNYPGAFDTTLPAWGVIRPQSSRPGSSTGGTGYSAGSTPSPSNVDFEKQSDRFAVILSRVNELSLDREDLEKLKQASLLEMIYYMLETCTLQEMERHFDTYYEIFCFVKNLSPGPHHGAIIEKVKTIWVDWKEVCEASSRDWTEREKEMDSLVDALGGPPVAAVALKVGMVVASAPDDASDDDIDMMVDTLLKEVEGDSDVVVGDKYRDAMARHQFSIIPSHDPVTSGFTPRNLSASARRRVMIEWKDFQKHETLSMEGSGGSIFVRWGGLPAQSLFKVMFCPSRDTPYSGGCFIFDVAVPDTYPEKPPSMRLLTTGGGNVRFNPNLYQCGKVCLSLLGTWSGEPWNPKVSNLTQLFMSILAMIFVDDPYFNEPGFQHSKGTTQGDVSSNAYNTNIRYYTLKHAVREMVENPPAEFAAACTEHFRALWSHLRKEYATWITQEPSAERRGEMQSMVEESEKILFG